MKTTHNLPTTFMNKRISKMALWLGALVLHFIAFTDNSHAATVTVNIVNFSFSPDSVAINVGDTVTWRHQDSTPP